MAGIKQIDDLKGSFIVMNNSYRIKEKFIHGKHRCKHRSFLGAKSFIIYFEIANFEIINCMSYYLLETNYSTFTLINKDI